MAGQPPLIVPAIKKHTASVIMMHGLGDSGAGWVDLPKNWRLRSKFEEVKFVFPNAPIIPITVNLGFQMPGWYNIVSFESLRDEEDEMGIMKSRDYFHSLIKNEIDGGIPSDRIVIGGFSQGGAMSILSGITCPQKLGGIFGLSCYLLLRNKLQSLISQHNLETPIFMGHGDNDPLVLPKWGQMTADTIKQWGFRVNLKFYPGLGHSAVPQEIDDLETFIGERIPPLGE